MRNTLPPKRSRRLEVKKQNMTAMEAQWDFEHHRFRPARPEAGKRAERANMLKLLEQDWIRLGSWRVCDECGLHWWSTQRKCRLAQEDDLRSSTSITATPPADVVDARAQPKALGERPYRYITPQEKDFVLEYEGQKINLLTFTNEEQLLTLTKEEQHSLALIDIHADFKHVKGGRAKLQYKQRTAVVSAMWRARPVTSNLSSANARLAFNALCENNEVYRAYANEQIGLGTANTQALKRRLGA